MKRTAARYFSVAALALVACGGASEAGPGTSGVTEADTSGGAESIAPGQIAIDSATSGPTASSPAGGAESDASAEAHAAGLRREEFQGVQLFWHAPEGYHEALLFPMRPAIENGCLMLGEMVIVWYATDVGVARGLISALLAGEAVDEMSLGGGMGPPSSPYVRAIRERCGTESVFGAGPIER